MATIQNKLFLLFLISSCELLVSCSESREIMNDPVDIVVEEEEETFTDTLSYLALGDSYTIGQGVLDEAGRWPNQLGKKLEENGYKISPINIIAKTGWSTGKLLEAIETSSPENHDLVSLLIGVNNQYQGVPFEVFQTEFDSLLNISLELSGAGKKVFVVSIPDYSVTPFGASNSEQIAAEIDMYNDYIEQRCMALDIPFINVTEISRQLGNSSGALVVDNLHPSASQYAQWVNLIHPVVRDLITE